MSKQAEAKAAQGYEAKPVPRSCATCTNLKLNRRLPDWMVAAKKDWSGKPYTVESHGVDKDLRCGIGGFAVKKTGVCNAYASKVAA